MKTKPSDLFCKPTFFVPLVAFISVMLAALAKKERNKTIASALIGFCVIVMVENCGMPDEKKV